MSTITTSVSSSPDGTPITFDQWYEQLISLAEQEAWDIGAPEDKDIWIDYYLDGDSPQDALQDDIDHA